MKLSRYVGLTVRNLRIFPLLPSTDMVCLAFDIANLAHANIRSEIDFIGCYKLVARRQIVVSQNKKIHSQVT